MITSIKNTLKKIVIVGTLTFLGTIALSEAFGPLGHAMHGMLTAKMCLKGELTAFLCTGGQVEIFKNQAKAARAALLSNLSHRVARQPMAAIEAVMARGHAEFAKR